MILTFVFIMCFMSVLHAPKTGNRKAFIYKSWQWFKTKVIYIFLKISNTDYLKLHGVAYRLYQQLRCFWPFYFTCTWYWLSKLKSVNSCCKKALEHTLVTKQKAAPQKHSLLSKPHSLRGKHSWKLSDEILHHAAQ